MIDQREQDAFGIGRHGAQSGLHELVWPER